MGSRSQNKKTESFHTFSELENMSVNVSKPRNAENLDEPRNYICEDFQVGLEDDSVAVVIDGSNLYKLARTIQASMPNQSRFSIDYNTLSKVLNANFPNIKRKWFIASQTIVKNNDENNGYSAIRNLLDWLEYHQYLVVTRDIIVDNTNNDEGETRKPFYPSMDIEITTALFKAAKIAQRIVFFGSDRKWEIPLKTLRDEYDKTITVVSATMPGKRFVADELRKVDHFVDLNTPWFHDIFKRRDDHPRNFND